MWSEGLYFDATKVEANASLDSMRSRSLMEHGLEEHLADILPEEMTFIVPSTCRSWASCSTVQRIFSILTALSQPFRF